MPWNPWSALRVLLRRGVAVAILARVFVAVFKTIADASASRHATSATTMRLEPAASAGFAVLCGLLLMIDVMRRKDFLFFANLGAGTSTIAACAMAPALLIELAIAVLG